MNFIPCAFINSEENPIQIGDWKGFWVEEKDNRELALYGSRTDGYNHPQAPGEAILSVYHRKEILTAKPGDDKYPILYMLQQAQKAVEIILR